MDAFYASVEQRDNPELIGKPIAVGGGSKRGVVAAASYEARKFGVRSAMPSARAARLCPDLIFIKPRFDAYKEASGVIKEIFRSYTDLVEPLSLDEAYLDVTESKKGPPSATLIAKAIKKEIKEATRLTASAGVSYCKFLAKMASDEDKPDGLFVILPKDALAYISRLPIGKFYGIGPATERRMKKHGIHTGADLQSKDEAFLTKNFGKSGRYYFRVCRGEDKREVKPHRIRKSVGAERTFFDDVTEHQEMLSKLLKIAKTVAERSEKIRAKGKTVTVKIRYGDFETHTRSKSVAEPISGYQDIADLTRMLFNSPEPPIRGVRLLGVTLSNLVHENDKAPEEDQLGLF